MSEPPEKRRWQLAPTSAEIPNVRYYYGWTFLMNLTFWTPVIAVFYQANNLTFAQMLLLQSVYMTLTLLVDIPTSVLSDLIGRRRLLQAATLVSGLGFAVYTLSSSFWGFLAAESLIGLAAGAYRGVGSAFVYDSLINAGKQGRDRAVLSTAYALLIAGTTVASLVGGTVAEAFTPRTTLMMSALASVAALVVTFFFAEPLEPSKATRLTFGAFRDRLLAGGSQVVQSKTLVILAVDMAVLAAISQSAGWFTQPHLLGLGVSMGALGAFYTFARLAAFFMVKLIPALDKRLGFTLGALVVRLPVPLSLLALALWPHPVVAFLAFGLLVVAMHMRTLFYSLSVNRAVPSDVRATVLSFISFAVSLTGVVLGPVIGWVTDHTSITTSCLALAAVSSVLVLVARLRPLEIGRKGVRASE